jgi:hypothetical protein
VLPSFATLVTVPDPEASTGIPVIPLFWKSTDFCGLCVLKVAAVTVTPQANGTWKLGAADAGDWPAATNPNAGMTAAAARTANRRNLCMRLPP